MQVRTSVDRTGELMLVAPYNPEANERYRQSGGKFDRPTSAWVWPGCVSSAGAAVIADLFGASEETVRVRVMKGDARIAGRERLTLGGYVLCERRSRDSRVEMGDEVIILSGGFPASGGSVKNPAVWANDGTVFELEVRRDFAERLGLVAPEPVAENPLASFSDDEIRAEYARRFGA